MVAAAGGVRHLATGEHAGGVTSGAPDLGSGEMPEGAPKSITGSRSTLHFRIVWYLVQGGLSVQGSFLITLM